MLLEIKRVIKPPFLVGTVILGFLSIFKSQALSPFEALNSSFLSNCEGMWGHCPDVAVPRAFSTVSTGDSYIASSCAMKDEPAFKPLQGNTTFFWVSASWFPLYLWHQTQGHPHIPIAEGRVLLRCLWKVGLPLQQNPGNPLNSRDDMASTELTSNSCAEIGVPLDLRCWSTEIPGVA